MDAAFSSLLISLLFLLVRVALKLRSLRFHSLRLCRIAVFSIQTNVSLGKGEATSDQRVPLLLCPSAPSYKYPYSPSPLRALVSRRYGNKLHHHHRLCPLYYQTMNEVTVTSSQHRYLSCCTVDLVFRFSLVCNNITRRTKLANVDQVMRT